MNKKNNRKGFTTVELVIVIAVIAILAAVLIPTFANLITKANKSADLQNARNMYSEWIAAHDYTTGSPAQNLIVQVDTDSFLIVKGAQMQDEVYETEDDALDAAEFTEIDNPDGAAAGYANDYVLLTKTNNTVTGTAKELPTE